MLYIEEIQTRFGEYYGAVSNLKRPALSLISCSNDSHKCQELHFISNYTSSLLVTPVSV